MSSGGVVGEVQMKACPECKLAYESERTACARCGTALVHMQDARIGTLLAGRYLLESVIGQGGMATVYRAHHALVDRVCAVKVVSPLLARDATVRERFRREARSIQKLAHPNIVEVQDQGVTEDGTSYIVMEYLEGASLAVLIAEESVTLARALGIMIQLARGIGRAHDLDVVHRDLKPENVFVTRREDGSDLVKVLDFGIARSLHDTRLTDQGELSGTPQYMAPERIASADSGPATDLYALGVMFYELLVGELPFDGADVTTFFVKHLKDPPPDPRVRACEKGRPFDIPVALADSILRLLAKDPAARPVDAHRVVADLIAIARDAGIEVPPEPLFDPASSRRAVSSRMPDAARRWRRRLRTLEQEVERNLTELASGDRDGSVVEAYRRLGEFRGKIGRLADLDDIRVQVQTRAEAVAAMGHEARQRFGHAVDALGVEASHAREDERGAREAFERAAAGTSGARAAFLMAHKEIAFWEGRSGFSEPYLDLALAYRAAAQSMEAWCQKREDDRRTQKELEQRTRAVADLDFQIRELRSALAAHEETLEREEDALALEAERASRESDALERELTVLVDRIVEPLAKRPSTSLGESKIAGRA